jgi:hypothetical protein
VVAAVIRAPMDQKAAAAAHIAAWSASHLPEAERARFVEIARYRVRPGEFQAWQALWQRRA